MQNCDAVRMFQDQKQAVSADTRVNTEIEFEFHRQTGNDARRLLLVDPQIRQCHFPTRGSLIVFEILMISADAFLETSESLHAPLLQIDATGAERLDRGHVVADEQHGAPFLRDAVHLAEAFLLKCRVAYGKHFIDRKSTRLNSS